MSLSQGVRKKLFPVWVSAGALGDDPRVPSETKESFVNSIFCIVSTGVGVWVARRESQPSDEPLSGHGARWTQKAQQGQDKVLGMCRGQKETQDVHPELNTCVA